MTGEKNEDDDWDEPPGLTIEEATAVAVARIRRYAGVSLRWPGEVVDLLLDEGLCRLAAWRVYRELNQPELAAAAGLELAALQAMENGESSPNEDELERLAEALACRSGHLTEPEDDDD